MVILNLKRRGNYGSGAIGKFKINGVGRVTEGVKQLVWVDDNCETPSPKFLERS